MKPETLTALQESISKWESIISNNVADRGAANCPLCQLFIKDDCRGCPVRDKTGQHQCIDTPYHDWHRAHQPLFFPVELYVRNDRDRVLAQAELDFLKSLL